MLGHRRRAGGLTGRMSRNEGSLRSAAWAGLQDSVPRAALLPLHARVAGIQPDDWDHPSLLGVWGLRFSAYVVPEADRGYFTLGRLPNPGSKRDRSESLADRLPPLLELWPSRVWPGAVLVGDEVVGVWRRAAEAVTITLWDEQPDETIEAIAAEAKGLPIPGLERPITMSWSWLSHLTC